MCSYQNFSSDTFHVSSGKHAQNSLLNQYQTKKVILICGYGIVFMNTLIRGIRRKEIRDVLTSNCLWRKQIVILIWVDIRYNTSLIESWKVRENIVKVLLLLFYLDIIRIAVHAPFIDQTQWDTHIVTIIVGNQLRET